MSKKQKILSCVLSASLIACALPLAASAIEKPQMVRIVVENNTNTGEGVSWSGTLADKWVELKDDSTAVSLFTELAQDEGFTQTGAETGYITEIGGLAAEGMGGWMFGVDDWYGNSGISAFKASDGTLEDGDEIFLSYSMDWGNDIGFDFYNTSTKLKSLTSDTGALEQKGDNSFVLTLTEGTEAVRLTPTAENKSYRYKIYKNEYSPETSEDYKRTQDIPVSNGDIIYIGVGHDSWHSYLPEGVEETVYTVAVEIPGGEASQVSAEQSSQTSSEEESSGTDRQDEADMPYEDMLSEISERLKGSEYTNIGNEWELMTLARLNRLSDEDKMEYTERLSQHLSAEPAANATELAKYFITVASFGGEYYRMFDEAYIRQLADLENASKQGVNGIVYSLIALDTGAVSTEAQAEREAMVQELLNAQLEDGGWTFYGDVYDPDMTGMALQALAPYYLSGREDVVSAVDKAIGLLSSVQNENGSYSSYGSENCESTAQVVTALSALNIDADKDGRFIKNGKSALEALKSFYLSGQGSFSHIVGDAANKYSTAQGFYALCAYCRFELGMTRLYDMSDVVNSDPDQDSSSENESSAADTEGSSSVPENSISTEKTASAPAASGSVQTFATADGTAAMLIFPALACAAAAILFVITRKKPGAPTD